MAIKGLIRPEKDKEAKAAKEPRRPFAWNRFGISFWRPPTPPTLLKCMSLLAVALCARACLYVDRKRKRNRRTRGRRMIRMRRGVKRGTGPAREGGACSKKGGGIGRRRTESREDVITDNPKNTSNINQICESR